MTLFRIETFRPRWLPVLILLLLPPRAFAASKIAVGIFPTYDQSGVGFGSALSQHLTTLLYRELQKTAIEPILLNPGGLYTSVQDEFTGEYAEKNDVQMILVTVLLKPDMPKKGDFVIQVKSDLIDLKTGKSLASWQSSVPINRHEAFLERGGEVSYNGADYSFVSRKFEKQPLGKATRKLAEEVRDQFVQATRSLVPGTEIPIADSGKCTFTFRVAYVSKHAVSKSYDVMVYDKDETLAVTDGNLPVSAESGPLLIQLVLHDAPYKLPKQNIYQASTRVDCSRTPRSLTLQVGPSGEAYLKWE